MAEVRAGVEEAEFTHRTTKARRTIRQLGVIAADAVGEAVETVGEGADQSWIRYAVRGEGGRDLLDFVLHIEGDDAAEARHVRLSVGEYVVSQRRILHLFPVGPKSVDGLRSVRLFARYLQQIL